jgi:glycosyltransferase involved in cell wall biosynthesis
MKLVHLVLGKANPERSNGVNRVVDGLARAQAELDARLRVKVEVWGITTTPLAPTRERPYPLRLFSCAPTPWTLTRELRTALDELPRDSVVHMHGGYHPEFAAAARRLEARSIAWVLTPHGAFRDAVVRAGWLRKRLYLALFEARVLSLARAVHVFSAREARELAHYVPGARTVVLPNGVDTRVYRPSVRAPRSLALRFGYCGRLEEHTKGLDLLLDGFALHVAASAGNADDLRVIGDGTDRERVRERVRSLGLEGRVELCGALYGDDQLEALRGCDVFVHPSRHEGMPLAVLEAAALGLPCVLSEETNLADAFERCGAGWKLERNDAAHLALAFARCGELARTGKLASHGARAGELVRAHYDWREIALRSLEALYGVALPALAAA